MKEADRQLIRDAMVRKTGDELKVIFDAIENGNELETQEKVVEYLMRGLRNVDPAERVVKQTNIYRFAVLSQQKRQGKETLRDKLLEAGIRPSALKGLSRFSWKGIDDFAKDIVQMQPKKTIAPRDRHNKLVDLDAQVQLLEEQVLALQETKKSVEERLAALWRLVGQLSEKVRVRPDEHAGELKELRSEGGREIHVHVHLDKDF